MARTAGRHAAAGFTLLEIVVALAVFAIIGVMASRILAGVIDLGEATRDSGDALVRLQRAIGVVGRDVEQLAHRTVRDELGDVSRAVSVGDDGLLELTRMGWQNPLGAPRSELQRVAYALEEEGLARLFWPVLDRGPGAKPVTQALLPGVVEADFVAYDQHGEAHARWPPEAKRRDEREGDAEREEPHLAGIELRLVTEEHGRVERLWLVPTSAGVVQRRAAKAGGAEADEDERPSPSDGDSEDEVDDDEDWDTVYEE